VSTDERDGRPAEEPVGSVAEEAAKLFGALGDAFADRAGDDPGAGSSGFAGFPGFSGLSGLSGLAGRAARTLRDLDEHVATGAPECTYCPVCRTVHALRQTSPEVRAHLATAASALAQAASGWLATVVPDHAERQDGVEHIDLDPDPGTDTETDPEEDGR
jgi:hypothetical protein